MRFDSQSLIFKGGNWKITTNFPDKEVLQISFIIKENWVPSSILHIERLIHTVCINGFVKAEQEF